MLPHKDKLDFYAIAPYNPAKLKGKSMLQYSQESQDRITKLKELRGQKVNPYPERYEKKQNIAQILKMGEAELRDTDTIIQDPADQVQTAGRLVAYRSHGKLNFGHLQDHTGRIQICFMQDVLGENKIEFLNQIDVADYLGLKGEMFTTKHGELTIMVTDFTLLSKTIRPLPEKWHGLKDQEAKYRQRYLDLVSDRTTFDRFLFRSKFIRTLRDFYHQSDFIEIQTPVLVNKASGALAKPFLTHHNSLDIDIYLRIALETPQKEAIVGGFERTFEIGPVFRNEGMDPSHLQEFTMCEHYAAYWNFEDNMRFTEEMFKYLLEKLVGSTEVEIPDREGNLQKVDFSTPWPRATLQGLILKDADIDVDEHPTADALRQAIKAKGIDLSDVANYEKLGRGNLIDSLYKKVSRPKMIQPTFLISHPVELSPLARRNDENPAITDRFQLVVNSWEIVNAYSELIDPIDQRQRLEEQASLKAGGDEEAMMMDEPYIRAMEHGMPPISGWGMGIERVVALLTKQDNLRDVVLFPLLKPEKAEGATASEPTGEPEIKLDFTRDQAVKAVEKYVDTALQPHLYYVEAAMRALADHFGFADQSETWGLVGLLHDVDWSITQDEIDKTKHCGEILDKILNELKATPDFVEAIRSHNQAHGLPLDTTLKKALFAVDELCGLIVATALVRPSKDINDVEVKSVKKKFKDKAFAAGCDRQHIMTCETNLDITLDEFIEITLNAMKGLSL